VASYLLTGAAGFIGARTAELLLDAGHRVVGVDDVNDAYDPRVKRHRLARLAARPAFRFVELDIAKRDALAAARLERERYDALLNLAARAGVRASVVNPWVYVDTNVTGTLNLLEWCRTHGVRKFVLASTSSVYGGSAESVFREEQETSRPISPYAATKKAAEALCHTWHALHGLDVTVLRYFTVYGPAGRPDMSVFRFVRAIREGEPITVYGDGTMARDFTFVDDIARGTIAALRPLGYEVVNLGGERPAEVRELVATVERALGRRAEVRHEPPHPADVPRTAACIDKARRLLGWEPRVSLTEGVAAAVAWYEAERAWAREIRG
jgi:nucleoside-diphosphate-sugar epimerase